MLQTKPKLRFAPSPNGHMHAGHAYSALLNVYTAQALGGEFIIRMEDIDQLRCTEVYKDAWLKDLETIGVVSDAEIIYQSERQNAYEAALVKLMKIGVLYPCTATRGDIKRHYQTHTERKDPDGALVYPFLHKNLSLIQKQEIMTGNEPFALRIDMLVAVKLIKKLGKKCSFLEIDLERQQMVRRVFNPMVWGDVIIARKDIGTSYHLSVVVDDAMQNISHIVRGVDLYYATYIHRVLQILLDLPEPIYVHHCLIVDEDLNKLAKSNRSQPIRELLGATKELDFISDLLKSVNMRKLATIIAETGQK